MFSNTGVTLYTRLGFLPKIYGHHVKTHLMVPAMHNQTDRTHRLWRALNEYLRHTSEIRQEDKTQLLVAFGEEVKGKPVSKQKLFKWLVECVKYKNNLPTPKGSFISSRQEVDVISSPHVFL